MARKIQVEIVGDARSLEKAFKRAGSAGDGFSRKMSTLGKVVGAGLGGGILAFGFAMRRGFRELANAQKVAAQTNAVLKSTGGIANVTAGRVNKLASSLSRMSGIDDEDIQAIENMLLTFTNIRNGAAKNEKIFDQTTRAVLDLSVATGKDMTSSAIMVGKALNDLEVNSRGTITGWSALRRVGVMVTKDVMAQGAAFIKAGQPMKAQALILKELNTEFGGSARAFGNTMPGALGKLRNAFDELMAAFATGFLPLILKVANALTKKMADPAFVARVREIGNLVGTKLYNAFILISNWFQAHWGEIRAGFGNFVTIMRRAVGLAQGLKSALLTITTPLRKQFEILMQIWDKLLGMVSSTAGFMSKLPFVGDKFKGVQESVDAAREVMRDPLGKKAAKAAKKQAAVVREAPGAVRPRALGGPVIAGASYLVGERGPEMFTPRVSGNISPGMGGGVYIANVSLPGVTNPRQFLAELQRIGKRGTAQQRGRHGGQNLALG